MNKEDIINSFSKSRFQGLISIKDIALDIFNDEGIEITMNSPLKSERLSYILTYSPDRDRLFDNPKFIDLLLNCDISYMYSLKLLRIETCHKIIKRAFEKNMDNKSVAKLLNYMPEECLIDVLDNWQYSNELLYNLFVGCTPKVMKKIIDSFDIDLTSHFINIKGLFEYLKRSALKDWKNSNTHEGEVINLNIPNYMFNKKLFNKIWDKYDIFTLRALINDAYYFGNPSNLNYLLKDKEEKIINDSINSDLIYPYEELYFIYTKLNEAINNQSDDYYKYKRLYMGFFKTGMFDEEVYKNIENFYEDGGLDKVLEYLKELNGKVISNYIIDYHFEENYYNVIIDMKELLYFYNEGNIDIPEDRVKLYKKIVNIDNLSKEEKIKLHEKLKSINIIELFYDDMSFARDIVAKAIKDYSLSKVSLIKYKDEELSKKYGVDVYKMDNKPFFGIVKTDTHTSEKLPAGHSYSLIGNNGLAVYGDAGRATTYLYDASMLNPRQVIHVFPYDSFTYFHPYEVSGNPTDRVYTLLMPKQIVETSLFAYTEVLILEEGSLDMETNKNIPALEKIALYCKEEISDIAIQNAKEKGLGIILVSAENCKINDIDSNHRVIEPDYRYYNAMDKKEFESKR